MKSLSNIQQYHRELIEKDLIDLPETRRSKRSKPGKGDFPPAQIDPIQTGCSWMRHCKEDAATLPEPEWHAMLSILGRCENGEDLAHKWSEPYAGYSEGETEKKLDHALEAAGPVTCQRVWDLTNGEHCKNCELWDVITSPINIGTPDPQKESLEKAKEVAREAIESNEAGVIFKKENIQAFRELKEKSPEDFVRLKTELKDNLKRKLNLRDFETALKQKPKEPHLRVVEDGEKPPTLDTYLEGVPTKGLQAPSGYRIQEKRILKFNMDGSVYDVASMPMILSRRLINVDTNKEKLELAFYQRNRWRTLIADRSTLLNKSSIIKLADYGPLISSSNAAKVVGYLEAFEAENQETIPEIRSVSHLGWVDGQYDRFLPGAEEGVELDAFGSITKGYRAKGTLEEWVENVRPVLRFPIARLLLASSFASPLLRVIGHRNGLIYPYGMTRGGKTAALKVALSAWGDPEQTMTSFNSTRNALERRAAIYSDLPIGIDERQVVGDRQGFVESIVYMLGNGQSRGRATKDGGLQDEHTWNSLTLATGEEPISSDSSIGGVKSRVLEIYGRPIDDEELASQMHVVTAEAHGVAGPEFIRRVIEKLKTDPDTFKNDFKAARDEMKKRCPENVDSHISITAAILLGDVYMNHWFFGASEDGAVKDAMDLGQTILDQLEKKSDIDDGKRAYEALMSWFAENEGHFDEEPLQGKPFGWVDEHNRLLCIYPTKFKEALERLERSPNRVRKDWVERGWIEAGSESDGKRTAIRKKNPHKNGKWERVIAVKLRE